MDDVIYASNEPGLLGLRHTTGRLVLSMVTRFDDVDTAVRANPSIVEAARSVPQFVMSFGESDGGPLTVNAVVRTWDQQSAGEFIRAFAHERIATNAPWHAEAMSYRLEAVAAEIPRSRWPIAAALRVGERPTVAIEFDQNF